jgi:hypothetical protein
MARGYHRVLLARSVAYVEEDVGIALVEDLVY